MGALITSRTPAVPPAPSFAPRGFTLTEMAVVLAIIALLIGGMILPLSTQQNLRMTASTQQTLSDAREALIGFAATNGRLPCPATSTSKGVEQPSGGGTCTCVSPDCYLPAATLGINPIDSTTGLALDGWNASIRYAVTSANSSAFTTANGIKNNWSSLAPDLSVCSDSACSLPLTSNAVAVIWSTGKNHASGGSSNDEMENPNENSATYPDPTPGRFVSHEITDNFDDVLTWLSSSILYNRMISAGKLP